MSGKMIYVQGRSILLALCAVLSFSDCRKTNPEETVDLRVPFTITVGRDTASVASTRAVFNGGLVSFEDGESIAVWDGTSINRFTTKDGGKFAKFEGLALPSGSYFILSPYTENVVFDGDNIKFNIPAEQIARLNSVDPSALFAACKTTDISASAKITLEYMVSLLKFTVPGNLGVMEIQVGGGSNCAEKICGASVYNSTSNTVLGNPGSNVVSLKSADGKSLSQGVYYIVVRPDTYNGVVVGYVDDNHTLSKRVGSQYLSVGIGKSREMPSLVGFTSVTQTGTLMQATGTTNFFKNLSNYTTAEKLIFKSHSIYNSEGGALVNLSGTTNIHAFWNASDKSYTFYTEAPEITLNSWQFGAYFKTVKQVVFDNVKATNTFPAQWFNGAVCKLETISFGVADFQDVTTFKQMFQYVSTLKSVDMSYVNTRDLNNCQYMFNGCTNLETIKIGFTLPSTVTSMLLSTASGISGKCDLYIAASEQSKLANTGWTADKFNVITY